MMSAIEINFFKTDLQLFGQVIEKLTIEWSKMIEKHYQIEWLFNVKYFKGA
jgi:hypothetical protein